jgi:RNA polymerase sigma factor (sigma-70 family)
VSYTLESPLAIVDLETTGGRPACDRVTEIGDIEVVKIAEEVIVREELEAEQREELLKAVNHLNSRQKETLFLRYYHGLTNAEIAEVKDINPQSVRNHLARAIMSLRALVQPPTLSSWPP